MKMCMSPFKCNQKQKYCFLPCQDTCQEHSTWRRFHWILPTRRNTRRGPSLCAALAPRRRNEQKGYEITRRLKLSWIPSGPGNSSRCIFRGQIYHYRATAVAYRILVWKRTKEKQNARGFLYTLLTFSDAFHPLSHQLLTIDLLLATECVHSLMYGYMVLRRRKGLSPKSFKGSVSFQA